MLVPSYCIVFKDPETWNKHDALQVQNLWIFIFIFIISPTNYILLGKGAH